MNFDRLFLWILHNSLIIDWWSVACYRSLPLFRWLAPPLIVVLFLHRLGHSSLAADNMRVQDESVLESAAADRAYLARHDAALEPLVSAQGRRGLIRFPASVALIFDVTRVLLPRNPRRLVCCLIESLLAPGMVMR